MSPEARLHQLIATLHAGEITDTEFAELEVALLEAPEARALYHRLCRVDGQLRKEAGAPEAPAQELPSSLPIHPVSWGIAAAMLVGIGVLLGAFSGPSSPEAIATLASVEEASWQSSLPTAPGSELSQGTLTLTSGIAMIRFRSGAELTLEAPARITLETPMRARLLTGAAMVEVPESAIGFVLETPGGYAVDHGTQFAVRVDEAGEQSRFEVIEGEISVHLHEGDEEILLEGEKQGATISGRKLSSFDGQEQVPSAKAERHVIRIGTNGRATSVIANNRFRSLPPDVLTAKRSENGKWDQRSLLEFDLGELDLSVVDSAKLRLNLVPAVRGEATRLPRINRFAIYGLANEAKTGWAIGCTWEEAPGLEDCQLLGTFEIPRSRDRGSYTVEDRRILEFLRPREGRRVTLVLVRETGVNAGDLPGPAHSFAADSHPEAAGPRLELTIKERTIEQ